MSTQEIPDAVTLPSSSSCSLRVLHCDPSSITVGWKFLSETVHVDYAEQQYGGEEVCVHHAVSIRLSRPGLIGSWVEVYRGRGGGCSISPLLPATSYHVRLLSCSCSAGCHHDDDSPSTTSTCYIMARTA